jgi:hypothetical protein
MHTARALTDNLALLLRREHAALGEFLVALADFDRGRVWEQLGHASLFSFLVRELHLSKAAAQYRKVAAELIQRVPDVIEPLRDGRLCLTSIIEAAKVVTLENVGVVLPRFFGLSRREAMEVVAELQPHPAPPARTVVTCARVASRARVGDVSPAPVLALDPSSPPAATPEAVGSPDELTASEIRVAPAPAVRPTQVVPLTAEERRLHVTVSARFLKKLQAARDALSHADPSASDEAILEAGLDLLLAQAAKRKGVVDRPQKVARPAAPAHIPAHVKRAVWARDEGRCQFPLASGGVCGSTRQVEFDHVEPLALGGPSTVENVRLACKPHNLRAARLALGDEWMDRYASSRPRPDSTSGTRDAGAS